MQKKKKKSNKVNDRNNKSFMHWANATLLLFGEWFYNPIFLGFRNSPSSITFGKSDTKKWENLRNKLTTHKEFSDAQIKQTNK